MNRLTNSVLLATAFTFVTATAEDAKCSKISEMIVSGVEADRTSVLGIVSKQVAESPGCVCEIVKTAITATEADAKTVAAIVEVAITESPEQTRLIAQCATAVAPDALSAIQALLATMDQNSEELGSDLGAKSSVPDEPGEADSYPDNPLDFPGAQISPVPSPNLDFGFPGGMPLPFQQPDPITNPNPDSQAGNS